MKNLPKPISFLIALALILTLLPASAAAAPQPPALSPGEFLEDFAASFAPAQQSAASLGALSNAAIAGGMDHTLAVKPDGTLWVWGNNNRGQLGDDSTTMRTTPVNILDDAVAVAAGETLSIALKSDGTLWGWGVNFYGQLGDGTTTNRRTPGKILDDVVAVATGKAHSLAIKSDGTLWAWGDNWGNQLGDGTTTQRNTPVKILDGVVAVAAGEYHSLAIKTDGTLWAWGRNNNGQLGDNTTAQRDTPVKILDDAVAIAAGGGHSLAIKDDGSLWAWGLNGDGQLGDSSTTRRLTPVKILDDAVTIAAGNSYSFAIKDDGSLWAWGRNNLGQLGDGSESRRTSPVMILDGAAAVAAGDSHSLAIKSDGSLWSWGWNQYGQLGLDHTNEGINTPHFVMSLYDEDIPAALTGTPAISNTAPRIGDVLTATLTNTNNTGTLTYTWKADAEQIGTGTTYTVTLTDLGKTITLEITSSIETGILTIPATDAVRKIAPPAAPDAPTLQSKTPSSITLTPDETAEFSLDGTIWQTGNTFADLTPNTAYTIYQRTAETPDTEASPASAPLTVTTDAAVGDDYTVAFIANGGVGAMQNSDATGGESFRIPLHAFVRANHTFVGWNTQANGSGTPYLPQAVIGEITESITLYAQWTRNAVGVGPGPILVPDW